jgi:hypothetical protein
MEGEQVVYRCPKAPAGEQGGTSTGASGKREPERVFTPLQFIARIAALIPTIKVFFESPKCVEYSGTGRCRS